MDNMMFTGTQVWKLHKLYLCYSLNTPGYHLSDNDIFIAKMISLIHYYKMKVKYNMLNMFIEKHVPIAKKFW